MLATIKQALRITHNKLDTDIQNTIDASKKELIRIGCAESIVNGTVVSSTTVYEPLIIEAVKTYCQMNYTDDTKKREMYTLAWENISDSLRKSSAYNTEVNENV